jgi:hypothetical protein
MSELHEQIVEIFLSTREWRDEPWEEKNFMEFLILPNGEKLRKSFKGCRYSLRFINRIEEECCVCFPQSFYDKEWNFSDFVAYVEKRKAKPGVDLRMATNSLQECKWHYGLIFGIIFLPITVPLLGFGIYAVFRLEFRTAFVMLALVGAINWVHAITILRQIFHLKRLIRKLNTETAKRDSGRRKATASPAPASRDASA